MEKPKSEFFVNTGLYVFKPKILNLIPKNEFFHMTQLIEKVKMKKYTVGVYPIRDTDWIDIGQITNYKDLVIEINTNNNLCLKNFICSI